MTKEELIIINTTEALLHARINDWMRTDLFEPRWWLLVCTLIVPWFFWAWLVDKRSIKEIALYGILVSGTAIVIDEIGSGLGMWYYPFKIIPVFPRLIAVNYSIVPIIYMLIYQYFKEWKPFVIINVIQAVVFALVLEPIIVWAGFYRLFTWKYVYSIPIYLFTPIFFKFVIQLIRKIETSAK